MDTVFVEKIKKIKNKNKTMCMNKTSKYTVPYDHPSFQSSDAPEKHTNSLSTGHAARSDSKI